MKWYIRRS